MKRFLALVRNRGYSPADSRRLIEAFRARGFRVVDVRVATNHVEVDILHEKTPELSGEEVIEILEITEKPVSAPPETVEKAVALFNSERFWEAHETLEPLWRQSKPPEKDVLHGLILTAAAFVHLQKNDVKGFRSILRRALKALSNAPKSYQGVSIDALRREIENVMENPRPFRIFLSDDG
ncbi:MAG: DUF309 domain-containing protein [Candidatus Caldarchaeum sp.]